MSFDKSVSFSNTQQDAKHLLNDHRFDELLNSFRSAMEQLDICHKLSWKMFSEAAYAHDNQDYSIPLAVTKACLVAKTTMIDALFSQAPKTLANNSTENIDG